MNTPLRLLSLITFLTVVANGASPKNDFAKKSKAKLFEEAPARLYLPGTFTSKVIAPDTLIMIRDQVIADSAWKDDYRVKLYYDNKTQLVEDIGEYFSAQSWNPDTSNTYTLNAAGQVTQILVKRFADAAWNNKLRYLNTLDSSGNVTQTIAQIYNSNSWQSFARTQTTYDVNGNPLVVLNQLWDTNWTNDSRVTSVFNSIARTLTETTQNWKDSVWVDASREILKYGPQYLNNIIRQNWSDSAWVNDLRWVYNIRNGQIIDVIVSIWEVSAWENGALFTFSYQANRRSVLLFQLWEPSTSTWENYNRTLYTYGPPPTNLVGGQRNLIAKKIQLGSRGFIYSSEAGNTVNPRFYNLVGKQLSPVLPVK